MASIIRDRAASTQAMLDAFDDASLIAAALRFEAALARAQAAEGVISDAAAIAISSAAEALRITPDELAEEAAHAGTLAIPLVRRLRAAVGDEAHAREVHRGATSQDLADTALMLQARQAFSLLEPDAAALAAALAKLADREAETPMLGRTLLQPALPITLGLKAVGWMTAIDAARARLSHEADGALMLQLGGPVGTLGGMDGRGPAVVRRMAEALDLSAPTLPWHARRGAIAGLGSALAILTGEVGKLARDIALMAQGEVGEAAEPQVVGRGGSSAMAHKRNPTGCQLALSAAIRAPHLAATLISALPQEHERGLGGWQTEAPVLAELFQLTHGATAAMLAVIEGVELDRAAMARNLEHAGVGSDFGEAAALVQAALDARGRD